MGWMGWGAPLAVLVAVTGCSAEAQQATSLAQARKAHATVLTEKTREGTPAPKPPSGVLDIVHYTSPAGQLVGYLTPRPKQGGRHPAIVWISGGDSNTIGSFWDPAEPDNDQTASAFRDAGIVTFYPALRGGNDNPGYREGFYGEVDDILAAAEYLAKLDWVDPTQIYLGGHSTGGTLAMLAAESSGRFKGVFAFGPVEDVRYYGGDFSYSDLKDATEVKLRSPIYWLDGVTSPTFVIEGAGRGNIELLKAMQAKTQNPQLHFFGVPGRDHFSVLAPVTALIAQKIKAGNVTLTQQELSASQ